MANKLPEWEGGDFGDDGEVFRLRQSALRALNRREAGQGLVKSILHGFESQGDLVGMFLLAQANSVAQAFRQEFEKLVVAGLLGATDGLSAVEFVADRGVAEYRGNPDEMREYIEKITGLYEDAKMSVKIMQPVAEALARRGEGALPLYDDPVDDWLVLADDERYDMGLIVVAVMASANADNVTTHVEIDAENAEIGIFASRLILTYTRLAEQFGEAVQRALDLAGGSGVE